MRKMRSVKYVYLLLFASLLTMRAVVTEGAQILMFFNAVSRSHYILGEALGIGLADKGHNVTMVSPFRRQEEHPNYKEIVLDGLVEHSLSTMYTFANANMSTTGMIKHMFDVRNSLANITMQHPKVKELMNSSAKFDVFITEFNLNECIFGFSHYYNAIPIIFSTMGSNHWANSMAGLASNPATEPNILLNYKFPMTYYERVINTLFHIWITALDWYRFSVQESIYEDSFRPFYKGKHEDFPTLHQHSRNFSLIFLNNNVATTKLGPQLPYMVNVGGMHIKLKKLPQDLQMILDSSKDGVILFSMGGNLKSSKLPKKQLDAILVSLGKLKQNVLWKWEDKELPNKPSNVFIRSWLPQQDILAHNNSIAFITHGGMLGKLEAMYFGVPMLGIPIFGDQSMNIAQAVNDGFAVSVELNTISEASFSEALNEVINNPRYGQRAKELSAIFRDSPQTPLEKAVASVEYVLRHKGAPFLRTPVNEVPLYQMLLLDVLAGFIAGLALMIFLMYWLIINIYRICTKTLVRTNKVKKIN